MHTTNYNLQMLHQNQSMKEIAINDSFNKIDFLINRAVIDFIDTLPIKAEEGDLYIQKDNSLALYINNQWETFLPKKNMVFYVISKKAWVVFDDKWII